MAPLLIGLTSGKVNSKTTKLNFFSLYTKSPITINFTVSKLIKQSHEHYYLIASHLINPCSEIILGNQSINQQDYSLHMVSTDSKYQVVEQTKKVPQSD